MEIDAPTTGTYTYAGGNAQDKSNLPSAAQLMYLVDLYSFCLVLDKNLSSFDDAHVSIPYICDPLWTAPIFSWSRSKLSYPHPISSSGFNSQNMSSDSTGPDPLEAQIFMRAIITQRCIQVAICALLVYDVCESYKIKELDSALISMVVITVEKEVSYQK